MPSIIFDNSGTMVAANHNPVVLEAMKKENPMKALHIAALRHRLSRYVEGSAEWIGAAIELNRRQGRPLLDGIEDLV